MIRLGECMPSYVTAQSSCYDEPNCGEVEPKTSQQTRLCSAVRWFSFLLRRQGTKEITYSTYAVLSCLAWTTAPVTRAKPPSQTDFVGQISEGCRSSLRSQASSRCRIYKQHEIRGICRRYARISRIIALSKKGKCAAYLAIVHGVFYFKRTDLQQAYAAN